MAYTNIDAAFKQIREDFVELSKNAARAAANKAQKDIKEKADQFIKEYYEYKPKIYNERKMALYKLVEDYYAEKESSGGLTVKFGVTYEPSKIEGLHESKSQFHKSGKKWIPRSQFTKDNWATSNNGIPEAKFIAENFVSGIHYIDEYGNKIEDEESSDDKMQSFFDKELDNIVSEYISSELMSALAAYF